MKNIYPVISLPPDANSRVEQMGTKRKFWFEDADHARWLFKYNRTGHGDDWSEKIACQIAAALNIPHAQVELATFGEFPGVISRDFTEGGKHALTHGNELIAEMDPNYPRNQNHRVTEHTIENVRRVLDQPAIAIWQAGESMPLLAAKYFGEISTARDLFAGYLMVDALIGNTDRHHENWAIMAFGPSYFCRLAPTFDHASCLGFNLTDAERIDRLKGGGNRSVETFANKARSKLYIASSTKPLSTLGAFIEMTRDRPEVRQFWIERLRQVSGDDFREIIQGVPETRMSKPARDFAWALLLLNRNRILNWKE